MDKRMSNLKRMICFLVSVITFATISITGVFAAISIPDPMENFYVNDFANVIEKETADYIINLNEQLFDATGAQIVITTVDFTNWADIKDYNLELLSKWGIGDSKKNNGISFLLAIGDDNYACLQGEGLEKTLPAGDLYDIVYNNLEEDFAVKQYDAGVKKTFDALMDRVNDIYGTDIRYNSSYTARNVANNSGASGNMYREPYNEPGRNEPYVYTESRRSGSNAGVIIMAFFILIIFVAALSGSGRRRRYYGGGGYFPPPRRHGWFWGRSYRNMHYPPHHHHHPHGGMAPHHPRNNESRPPSGGGFFGGGHSNMGGGGSSRGGGMSRNSSGFGGGGFGGGGRSGGGFGGGHSNSGGGGSSRGGGMSRK